VKRYVNLPHPHDNYTRRPLKHSNHCIQLTKCTHAFQVLLILKTISDNFLSIIRMGYSLFWVSRHSLAIFADVSGQHVVPFSKVKQTLEDEIDILYRNVDKQLPTYAAQHQKRAKTWTKPRRKPRSSRHLTDLCNGEEVFQLGDGILNFKYNLW
jgi:hypothetical protein